MFALVSTAGIHLREQEPYNVDGDNSWRLIPGNIQTEQLMVTHSHYDHQDADQDINCIFPLDRLRELAAEGIIGGVGDKHLGFMGYTQNFRDLYERVAPEMAKTISRSQADAVILTAGCPLCHRVAAAIAREIEMTGIPTVFITVAPDQTRQAGPPRAIAPLRFTLGNSLGALDSQIYNARFCSMLSVASKQEKSLEPSGSQSMLNMTAASGNQLTFKRPKK
ncbi:hypothetical protein KSX_10180 [Ktedonospora formicarum]|uniref:D-proline reductase (Dithiol) protein PrdB n=1 Tax=Ktedonospora formicarum TaxID=2778364 RepID=A0A8J3HXG1_9CHLR|nr:hypothetical protein KSX_10180 [Ktedonospora formicarum]